MNNSSLNQPQYNDKHYAVVDLGSNSFHLLITHLQHNSFDVVDKIKSKVRLAAGLDDHNQLSDEAIQRGLTCLQSFASHLKTIPVKNISIVATATLRIAHNRNDFIAKANAILPKNIQLLSGEQEAELIYSGATNHSPFSRQAFPNQVLSNSNKAQEVLVENNLVLDIGGASTELIVGCGQEIKKIVSLNIGGVSFKQKCFNEGTLSNETFIQAIDAATEVIMPIAQGFIDVGWRSVLGHSGVMQALTEILTGKNEPINITSEFLDEIKQLLINFEHTKQIKIAGLRNDRIPVLASGLSILIALFNCLAIDQLTLSSGALREGLLHEVLQRLGE